MSCQVAILVDEKTLSGAADDRHLLNEALNWKINFLCWRSLDLKVIQESHAVIMRSPYSYIQDSDGFIANLQMIQDANPLLLNPLEVVRWNMHKQYLIQMRDQFRVNVPKMTIGNTPITQERHVVELLVDCVDSEEKYLIIKPAVSAGSTDTFKISMRSYRDSIHDILRAGFGKDREYIIQEYLPTIESEGELSLIFFGGIFSHGIRKIPAKEDFRVQAMFGGRNLLEDPVDPKALCFAETIIGHLREIFPPHIFSKMLYSRIDLVRTTSDDGSSSYSLMEIELIEPRLFFNEGGVSSVHAFFTAFNSIMSGQQREP